MSKYRVTHLFFVFALLITVLTGCLNNNSPAEQIYEVLESVVMTEKDFEDQQDPLVELEKKEKAIYEKIISIGMKEYDEIVKLAEEALTVVEQRKSHLDKEKESINNSKEQFEKIDSIIHEIKEEKLKERAKQLYNTMMDRYDLHEQLYNEYVQGLEYDQELYNMFMNEVTSMEELEEQITKINETYDRVLKVNDQFNEQTNQYNELKQQLYKEAGLNIKNENE